MSITFRTESHSGASSGTSITGTEPIGATTGDFIIAMYTTAASGNPALPSGWTSLYSVAQGGFKSVIGYVIRGSSPPSYAFTHTGSVYRELTMGCFKCKLGGVISVDSQSSSGATGNATTHNPDPPSTIAYASFVSMAICGGINFLGASGGWTAPSGFTNVFTTNGWDSVLSYKTLLANGSLDPGAYSGVGAGAGDYWDGFTITLSVTGERPVTTFCCGAECGVSGAHWTLGANGSFSTSSFRSGLRSVRMNVSGGNGAVLSVYSFPGTIGVVHGYIKIDTKPNGDAGIFGISISGSPSSANGLVYQNATGLYHCGYVNTGLPQTGFSATGVSLDPGWHKVDVRVLTTANPWIIDCMVDGVALEQVTRASASSNLGNVFLGPGINLLTADMYADDVVASATSDDYPLPDGYITSYIPNADGTHNVAGANDFERSLTGTDITNTTTDAWQLVNKRPLPAAGYASPTFINVVAPPSATDYVETAFEDSIENVDPLIAEFICAQHGAGGAGTSTITLVVKPDGSTAIYASVVTNNIGTAGMNYVLIHMTDADRFGAPWTKALINTFRCHVQSSDASPDIYIDGYMLEVMYPAALDPSNYSRPFGLRGSRLMQQLLAT